MSDTTSFAFNQTINCSASQAYNALTNASMLRQWLCANSQTSPRQGGRIYLYWQQGYAVMGEFTALEENKSVAYTWQGKNEPFVSNVAISIEEADGKTAVSLTHAGIPASDQWESLRTEIKTGWESSLANLKSIIETGLDKRIYDQPFLGILIGGVLSEAQANEQNIPFKGGIIINSTLPDTGAHEIGFENEDVLVQLGGSETANFNELRDALRPFKANENVPITYYRNGEKQSAVLRLSQRPAPQVPDTLAETVSALKKVYKELESELAQAIEGISEEAATYRPTENEWNVKEVIAHLIYTERFNQATLLAQVSNNALAGIPSNPPEWIAAITAVYPTAQAMADAWRNSTKELIQFIEHAPESFVNQKVFYINTLNNILNGLPGHTRSHIEQIKTLVSAAKGS